MEAVLSLAKTQLKSTVPLHMCADRWQNRLWRVAFASERWYSCPMQLVLPNLCHCSSRRMALNRARSQQTTSLTLSRWNLTVVQERLPCLWRFVSRSIRRQRRTAILVGKRTRRMA